MAEILKYYDLNTGIATSRACLYDTFLVAKSPLPSISAVFYYSDGVTTIGRAITTIADGKKTTFSAPFSIDRVYVNGIYSQAKLNVNLAVFSEPPSNGAPVVLAEAGLLVTSFSGATEYGLFELVVDSAAPAVIFATEPCEVSLDNNVFVPSCGIAIGLNTVYFKQIKDSALISKLNGVINEAMTVVSWVATQVTNTDITFINSTDIEVTLDLGLGEIGGVEFYEI